MAGFTPIALGVDWQNASTGPLYEIVGSYKERRLASGYDPVYDSGHEYIAGNIVNDSGVLKICTEGGTPGTFATYLDVVVGYDIQQAALWSEIQNGLIKICTKYLDENQTPADLSDDDPSVIVYWTADELMNSATGDTFYRRAQSWTPPAGPVLLDPIDADLRGYMQASDIIGPWIFEDLIAVMKLLKRTMISYSSSSGPYPVNRNYMEGNTGYEYNFYPNFDDMRDRCDAQCSWGDGADRDFYFYWCSRGVAWIRGYGYNWEYAIEARWKSRPDLAGTRQPVVCNDVSGNPLTFDWCDYLLPSVSKSTDNQSNIPEAEDLDATGMKNGKLFSHDDGEGTTGQDVVAEWIGDYSNTPFQCSPTGVNPNEPPPPGWVTGGYYCNSNTYVGSIYWFLDWKFSYT